MIRLSAAPASEVTGARSPVAVLGADADVVDAVVARLQAARLRTTTDADAARLVVLLLAGDADSRTRAIAEHAGHRPGTAIVATMPDDSRAGPLRRALRAGAAGLILDGDLVPAMTWTVYAVAAGQMAVPQALRRQVARTPLSYREKEILDLVVHGYTNRQIADTLFVAESTVKTHLSSIFDKLDARSRAEAAALALEVDADATLVLPALDTARSA